MTTQQRIRTAQHIALQLHADFSVQIDVTTDQRQGTDRYFASQEHGLQLAYAQLSGQEELRAATIESAIARGIRSDVNAYARRVRAMHAEVQADSARILEAFGL